LAAIVLTLAAGVAPAGAQDTLGDLVDSGGYDWIIGRWVATPDNDRKAQFIFDWVLDRHAVLSRLQVEDLRYEGLILLLPGSQDPFEEGADNQGGTWKGTWSPQGDGLVRRVDHTGADGRMRKGEMVFDKVDADTITVGIYLLDGSGSRNAEPVSKLTCKRQQAQAAAPRATAETPRRSTDHETLADIVAEGGYEWLMGKWSGSENGRTYELECQPILDGHGVTVNMKMGSFQYLGLITYAASRQEAMESGVDTLGRTWKMTYEQDGSDLVGQSEVTKPDGATQKLRQVYTKIDNDTFNVKLFGVAADGSRMGEPLEQVTFKRQKGPATAAPAK